jgi:endonuclease-8
MPEGDTIFRAATQLRKALEGARVRSFRSDVLPRARLDGQRIEEVSARGKNLLLRFESGLILRTHLRMKGSWHIYREGEPWQRAQRQARVELHADNGFVAVLFGATRETAYRPKTGEAPYLTVPIIELVKASEFEQGEVGQLGPDATTDAFDAALAHRRLRTRPELQLGDAILQQGLIAGVGNVIKSETLFLCRQDPFAPVGDLDDARLDAVLAEAHRLLLRNRDGGQRTTRESLDGGRLWVYGRSGRPCRVCGRTVGMQRQGAAGRSTYYCPGCQAAAPRR